jgi:hypothetical protein
VHTGASVRRRRRADGTRNPLAALAIAVPVAALLAYAFGDWSQFTIHATAVVHLMHH